MNLDLDDDFSTVSRGSRKTADDCCIEHDANEIAQAKTYLGDTIKWHRDPDAQGLVVGVEETDF
jgi:hypothetical protein